MSESQNKEKREKFEFRNSIYEQVTTKNDRLPPLLKKLEEELVKKPNKPAKKKKTKPKENKPKDETKAKSKPKEETKAKEEPAAKPAREKIDFPEQNIIRATFHIEYSGSNDLIGVGYELSQKNEYNKHKIKVAGSIARKQKPKYLEEVITEILDQANQVPDVKLVILRYDKNVMVKDPDQKEQLRHKFEKKYPFKIIFMVAPNIVENMTGIKKNASNALKFKKDKVYRNRGEGV